MQISATHLSVIWTFWVMVWYMNTLFIYWLYLGITMTLLQVCLVIFFPIYLREQSDWFTSGKPPLYLEMCHLPTVAGHFMHKKKKILVDILPQLFNFEVPQLSQRQIWSMITLPGTFHAGLSSLLLLSFFISSEVKCQNWKRHHAWAD